MFRKTKITLALVAAPAAAMLAMGAGVASASAVPSSVTDSQNLAGYATQDTGGGGSSGVVAFNEVRTNLQNLPSFSGNIGGVAHGVVMQRYSTGTADPTAGFGLVNGVAVPGGLTCDNGNNPQNQWILKFGFTTEHAGTPVRPSQLTAYVFDSGQLTCVAPGTPNYYIHIHDSTFGNCIGLDAGFIEPGDVVTNGVNSMTGTAPECLPLGEQEGFGNAIRFHEVGVGVAAEDAGAADQIPNGTVFSFWRDGVTVLLDPSLPAGPTNSRLTLDHFNMREFIATQSGGAPAPGNALVMSPGPLGVGSAFKVMVP